MKKYLMTGIAALALCAGFTSCSHDLDAPSQEDLSNLEAQKNIATYKAAFENYIGGKVSPNQTWGFSGTFATRTRGAYPNANQWANDGYKAPKELSVGQKTRVMAYFQANPYLKYVDPLYTDFFVQQVYKGYTSPGAISPEVYQPTDTNNDPVVGSDHMDHLTFGIKSDGTAKDHDNNFNHGRYSDYNASDANGTPRDNVQNWPGVTYLNDNGNGTHQDHIMLMLDSSTESVGFQDSEGSRVHLDCCANASAAVIDAWAIAHQDSLKTIGKFGETVTDEWERSFVGLDYEQKTLEDLYTGSTAKALDFCDGNSQYILYKGQLYAKSDFADFELKNPGNEAVKYIQDNVSNMGIAEYIKYTKSDNTVGNVTKDAYNYNLSREEFKTLYNVTITNDRAGLYNLDMILGYIYQSALPTQNNGNWVKNIGGRDYVFSDWIVTLTKAPKYTVEKPGNVRVMAEDLTLGTTDEDFDFNDVVFDVYFSTTTEPAKVVIRAAGGTLDLRIANVENPTSDADWFEVHELFNEKNNRTDLAGKMLNTNGTDADQPANVRSRSVDNLACPEFNLPAEFSITSNADAKKIKIQVKRNNVWTDIEADQGQPAAKFAVPTTVTWMKERVSIKSRYGEFTTWATTAPNLEWWNSAQE